MAVGKRYARGYKSKQKSVIRNQQSLHPGGGRRIEKNTGPSPEGRDRPAYRVNETYIQTAPLKLNPGVSGAAAPDFQSAGPALPCPRTRPMWSLSCGFSARKTPQSFQENPFSRSQGGPAGGKSSPCALIRFLSTCHSISYRRGAASSRRIRRHSRSRNRGGERSCRGFLKAPDRAARS